MLKFLGALCILSACGAYSFYYISCQRAGRKATGELSALLEHLGNSIRFQLEPLPSLIDRLSADASAPTAAFLAHLSACLNSEERPTLSVAWANAVNAYGTEHNLPPRATSVVLALGTHLGQADFETEAHRLIQASQQLAELAKELDTQGTTAEKTAKTLGLLLGAFIVIILL